MLKEHEKLGVITRVIEKMSNKRLNSVSDVKPEDYENNGSLISVHTAVRHIVLEYFDRAKDENANSKLQKIYFYVLCVKKQELNFSVIVQLFNYFIMLPNILDNR